MRPSPRWTSEIRSDTRVSAQGSCSPTPCGRRLETETVSVLHSIPSSSKNTHNVADGEFLAFPSLRATVLEGARQRVWQLTRKSVRHQGDRRGDVDWDWLIQRCSPRLVPGTPIPGVRPLRNHQCVIFVIVPEWRKGIRGIRVRDARGKEVMTWLRRTVRPEVVCGLSEGGEWCLLGRLDTSWRSGGAA